MTNTTKMLINAQRAEQLRVAIIEGTHLKEYQVEIAEGGLTRGNIYRGVVANVQPSLNAAFIDIDEDRHGFLPITDIQAPAYHKQPPEDERRPRIDQVLERGRPIFVQVAKDGTGTKGPALITNLALAGRYLVLTPFEEMRGISRKIQDDDARKKVRERLAKLDLPEGFGVIVRTNGLEQTQTALNRDLNALLRLWKKVRAELGKGRGAKLVYSDQDLVVQALRDYLDTTIEQVIVDSDEVFEKAEAFMQAFMPRSKTKLVRYTERQPLFSRFQIEPQIDRIYERSVPLPGGGSIVIDITEALTAIDVNSGRATRSTDYEESIFQVNMEAAEEVARQLRLRDLGGLVVVDFIDMRVRKHQRKLEKAIRDAMKVDRARHTIGRISSNGLVEINRQKIKQALRHRTHRPCPTCRGMGTIASPEFYALNLLGRIEARATTGLMESVMVILHPEVADALQNGHRAELAGLESEFGLKIEIIAAPNLSRTEERIEWTRRQGAVAAPKTKVPALSAEDLSAPARHRTRPEPEEAEEDDETPEAEDKRPRRRRRSRKRTTASDQEPQEGRDENGEAEPGRPRSRSRRRPRKRTAAEEAEAGKRDDGRRDDGRRDDGRRDDLRPEAGRPEAGRRDAGKRDAGRNEPSRKDAGTKDTGPAESEDEETRASRSRRRRRGGRGRTRNEPRDEREAPEARNEGAENGGTPSRPRRRPPRRRRPPEAGAAGGPPEGRAVPAEPRAPERPASPPPAPPKPEPSGVPEQFPSSGLSKWLWWKRPPKPDSE